MELRLPAIQGIGGAIESGLVNGIDAAVTGAQSLQDVRAGVLKDIGKMLISFGIRSLLGGVNIGGTPLVGKAAGGPVTGNTPYMVGERGPELFVPGSSGKIVPNNALGSGGGSANIVVNVDASGSSVQGNEQEGRQLGQLIAAAIQQELIKQKRPGGLLV
jgi:hypothetical protein